MSRVVRSNRWVTFGLLGLCLIPTVAGLVRLVQLVSGVPITPDNARFFAAPTPVSVHIVSSCLFCIAGVFQFSARFRQRNPSWHRLSGRILVPTGLIAAISGLDLTLTYPPAPFDGPALFAMRLLVAPAMCVCLLMGLYKIKVRDFASHRAWMIRAYALGMGAGTQVLTHLPWFLIPAIRSEAGRAFVMGAGWAINIAVAEWFLRNKHTSKFL